MLYKFKSQADADLIMLEADGRRLLQAMLGEAPVKGIVKWQDLPAVLTRIRAAVAQDDAERLAHSQSEANQSKAPMRGHSQAGGLPAVRLGQRAAPMLKMIERSLLEESDIVWGV